MPEPHPRDMPAGVGRDLTERLAERVGVRCYAIGCHSPRVDAAGKESVRVSGKEGINVQNDIFNRDVSVGRRNNQYASVWPLLVYFVNKSSLMPLVLSGEGIVNTSREYCCSVNRDGAQTFKIIWLHLGCVIERGRLIWKYSHSGSSLIERHSSKQIALFPNVTHLNRSRRADNKYSLSENVSGRYMSRVMKLKFNR